MKIVRAKNELDWEAASTLLLQVVDRLNGLERPLWAKELQVAWYQLQINKVRAIL